MTCLNPDTKHWLTYVQHKVPGNKLLMYDQHIQKNSKQLLSIL